MNICIIGAGHVGLVTGAVFAEYGNDVICIDNDKEKIKSLQNGNVPFFEPGLLELVTKNSRASRLSFSADIAHGVKNSEVIFICVGTPPREDGSPNLVYVENVARDIAKNLNGYKIIVEKSTVPIETGEWVERTAKQVASPSAEFDVASNPEFLREGQAVDDAMHPDRVVLGVQSRRAKDILEKLYEPFKAPVIFCDIRTAELIKHACNAFLATKISYINAIAMLCGSLGADVTKVAEGMGLDPRIGKYFLRAGIGYGGFCFPKDLSAFIHIARKSGYEFDLLKAVEKINTQARQNFVEKIKKALWNLEGKSIAVLGLSFKPDTDDLRFAPALDVVAELLQGGARVCVSDPQAMEEAKAIFHGKEEKFKQNIKFCQSAREAVSGADALCLLTEWKEFLTMDFHKVKSLMSRPLIFDGRNALNKDALLEMGFEYHGVGR